MTITALRPWHRIAVLLILSVAPMALLWPFRHALFVSDDRWFATGTLVAADSDWLTARWPHPFGPAHAYRPLVILSYLLTRAYSAGTPLVYHLTNFIVHGFNAALLAALVWRLGGSFATGFVAGLFFAIHPITHENVMWISGRGYPFATLCGLALLWWTVSRRGRPALFQHLAGAGLLVAALLSYEAAVTLPLMVAVMCYAADESEGVALRERFLAAARFALPYLIVVGIYLAYRWFVVSSFSGDADVWRHGTAPNPFLKSAYARVVENMLVFAARLFNGENLLLDRASLLRTCATLASGALIVVATMGALWSREIRWRALGALALAGVAFVPGALAPAFVDRLTYLSLAGIFTAVALGLSVVFHRVTRGGRAAIVMMVIVAATCWGAQSRIRGAEWQHAGDIAESFLDQLVALEPTPSPGASLHFVNVPGQFRSAYLYLTYFHHSVRQRYGREDLDVVTHDSASAREIVEELRAMQTHTRAASHEVVLFRWDPDSERLQLVARVTADDPPRPSPTGGQGVTR